MKILAAADGPFELVRTGFSRVMHKICLTLAKEGDHKVDLICHNYDGIPILNFRKNGYNIHRGSMSDFSVKEVHKFITEENIEKYDFFINIADIWRVSYNSLFRRGFDFLSIDFGITQWILYAEIDGIGTHEFGLGKGYLETLMSPDLVVVPTKFASGLLEKAGIEHKVIPHTVDPLTFYPESGEEARKKMQIDSEDFVFGSVGVPARRKGWYELLFAFREFLSSLPKDERERVKLYMHTDLSCKIDQLDLPNWINMLGIRKNIIAPNLKLGQYVPDEEMRKIYSTFDCFISASKIEGFNIPLIEAEACGIPIIATDYASHPEVVGDCGELIKVQNYTVNQSDIQMANIDIQHAVELMHKFYSSRQLRDKYGRRGPRRVKKLFSDDQNKEWLKIIEDFDQFNNIQRLII